MVPDAYFNVPAFTITILLTILLIVGIKESATVNAVKVFVILIFVIVGSFKVNPENYKPFVPPNEGTFSKFSVTGILSATSVIFFSYIMI